jgi:hypothetical protein
MSKAKQLFRKQNPTVTDTIKFMKSIPRNAIAFLHSVGLSDRYEPSYIEVPYYICERLFEQGYLQGKHDALNAVAKMDKEEGSHD